MTIHTELLALLVCPGCRGELEHQEDESRLVCQRCRLAYPVRGDIPVLLVDEATPL